MIIYELSATEIGIYGICAMLLMILAADVLVRVFTSHRKWKYMLPAVLLEVAVLLILQGLADVNYRQIHEESIPFLADRIGNLPCGVLSFCLFVEAVVCILLIVILRRDRREKLSPAAVKEGLDALPDGVCFFDEDGQPLLVNTQMNRICGELFHKEILNGEVFWQQLKDRRISDRKTVLRTEPTIMVRTKNGSVWDISRKILAIGHSKVHELTACDVTEQYELNEELDRRNRQLSVINERLRQYSREVEQITAENEILDAKIQVHNNVGRSLLAFRSYLAQAPEERDREELLLLWRYTIDILRHAEVSEEKTDSMEMLQKAAQAVDVSIIQKGELPSEGVLREQLVAALHECLTNTVKHANGDKLYVTTKLSSTEMTAEIRNNGKPPTGKIQETGGLKNLRCTIEGAGGRMIVESTPHFVLRLELPKGGNQKNEKESHDCR